MLAGDSVMVMGLGSVGLLMLQAVKAISAARVCGVDLLPERLQLALDLGADAVLEVPPGEQALRDLFTPFTEGRGADAVILTAPDIKPFMQAVASVPMGGAITIFAAHAGAAPLDLERIYQQELTITNAYSSSPATLRLALDLLATRQVLVDRLISHRLPLERFNEGVALMREHKALKVYFQIL